jgi:hypothetical protein
MQTDRNTTGHLPGITGQASTGLPWREGVAILTLATAATAWGQTTPNWGALSTASPQRAELATVATPASAPSAKPLAPATALGAKPTLTTSAVGAKAALLPSTKPALEKPALLPPAEVVAHLKSAGLDAKDPALGAKLKALAQQHGATYVRSRVTSMAPVVVKKAAPPLLSQIPGGMRNAARTTRPAQFAPETGYIEQWVASGRSINSPKPAVVADVGLLGWFVRANHLIAPGGVNGSYEIAFDCGGVNPKWSAFVANANEEIVNRFFPDASDAYKSSASGPPYGHVAMLYEDSLPIGHNRTGKVTIHFDNVTATATAVFAPTQAMATITATIDHTPTLTSVGLLVPWGSTGLSADNATLQDAGTPRVGSGDWTVNTQGNDSVGDGVQLGPGWTVTSTIIKSAMSASAPQDLTPDNAWRGAKVTLPPQAGTLRTGVAWHYRGVDSLDYTVEWTLTGPLGQRPLMTMTKHDSCDN